MDGYIGSAPRRGSSKDKPIPVPSVEPAGASAVKPLIFLHIPKTAGTSLIELLARNFAVGETLRMTDVHRPVDHLATDVEIALAEGKRLICGHFHYPVIAGLRDAVMPFTLLRDPVDRIVSLYRFWRTQDTGTGPMTAGRFACNLARALDFDDFIECDHPLIVSATRDEMCKTLRAPDAGVSDPDMLFPSARKTLDGMPFGIASRMTESLRLLSHRLGLNMASPIRLNTSDPSLLAIPTPEQRERIIRRNLADTALYDHATREFDRALQQLDVAQLYQTFGDRALTPLIADDNASFHWDASMPVSGMGWNQRESLADGTCYRFTSGTETTLHFPNPMRGQAFTMEVQVAFFHSNALLNHLGKVDALEALSFAINDRPLGLSISPACTSGTRYVLAVPALPEAGPVLQLSIRSPYGLSPSLFGSPDRRDLLAAISSIAIRK
jgi:hypothetical protein